MIERTPEKQIDLLIVVDQMLTGFDSSWVNTLYLDKVLRYENIIQAFSRTNRLFGPDKPFGTIRYYRKPHTMERNIEKAVKLYSGDKPMGLFVEKLEYNLNKLNALFDDISELFTRSGIADLKGCLMTVQFAENLRLCLNPSIIIWKLQNTRLYMGTVNVYVQSWPRQAKDSRWHETGWKHLFDTGAAL